jgi:polyhydroxybutyrate depolymerase
MAYSGMNEVADENGFVVCYPQGTTDQYDNSFFNVGYEFQNNPTVDDVGFIVALAEYLQNTHQLSNVNTFCTGMSNGGDMSYMLACEASSTFRAIAPVAGMILYDIYNSCNPDNPVPVFETHGTEDDVTYYEGDPDNADGWGSYLDIPSTIDYFVTQNNLTDVLFSELPDINTNDESTIESYIYTSPNSTNEVWLYKVINGGHDWPGAWGNMDVNISQEIWKFFSQMSLPEETSIDEIDFGNKKLIKVVDILGRETINKGFNIEIYNDGSIEKKYRK